MVVVDVPIKYENSQSLGIAHWISKRTGIADIHSAGLIEISVDSNNTLNSTMTAPIGFAPPGSNNWWGSNTSEVPHFYQINFKSFPITIHSYFIFKNQVHYFPTWTLYGSNNGNDWNVIDTRTLDAPPTQEVNFFSLQSSVSYRIIRISVHGHRFDGGADLVLGSFDVYGVIQWDVQSCKAINNLYAFPYVFIVLFVLCLLPNY